MYATIQVLISSPRNCVNFIQFNKENYVNNNCGYFNYSLAGRFNHFLYDWRIYSSSVGYCDYYDFNQNNQGEKRCLVKSYFSVSVSSSDKY